MNCACVAISVEVYSPAKGLKHKMEKGQDEGAKKKRKFEFAEKPGDPIPIIRNIEASENHDKNEEDRETNGLIFEKLKLHAFCRPSPLS